MHRWKARVVKEKKKERKEGGREGVWVVFRHQKHGVKNSRGQNWCRTNHGIETATTTKVDHEDWPH